MSAGWTPQFEGQRDPFEPGNVAALRSGHRSPRVYGPLAEQLAAGLMDDRPDLAAYPEAVAGWATVEAQVALLRRRLGEVGPLGDDLEPRTGLLVWLTRLEGMAARHRAALGLDPRAEASLTRDRAAAAAIAVAADLEALAARGRAVLAARGPAEPDPVAMALAAVQHPANPDGDQPSESEGTDS